EFRRVLFRSLASHQLKRNNPKITASPYQKATLEKSSSKSQSRVNMLNSNGTLDVNNHNKSNGSLLNTSFSTLSSDRSLNDSNRSQSPTEEKFEDSLIRPKSALEKARLNTAWLNSSISLYEQEVDPDDLLLLKFKFFAFYDLT